MGEPLVVCVDVTREYGSRAEIVTAVDTVNCTVGTGARIALTGPSGSGKSTLLHLFNALDTPTRGTVTWPAWPTRPGTTPGLVATVFQGPSLLTSLDVTENVMLPLQIAGADPAAARRTADVALQQVGLSAFATRLPEELSGGQAQRVAVARLIATAPRLILADEPTAQLDAAHRDQVVDLLISAADTLGAALVIATHDPRIAGRLPVRWSMAHGHLTTERTC